MAALARQIFIAQLKILDRHLDRNPEIYKRSECEIPGGGSRTIFGRAEEGH